MLDLRRLDLISYGQMILTNMLLKHMQQTMNMVRT